MRTFNLHDIHNYPRTIDESLKVAEENAVHRIMGNGDLGDSPVAFAYVLERIGESGIPFWGWFGSHEAGYFKTIVDFYQKKYPNIKFFSAPSVVQDGDHYVAILPGSDVISRGGSSQAIRKEVDFDTLHVSREGSIGASHNITSLVKKLKDLDPMKVYFYSHFPLEFKDRGEHAVDFAYFFEHRDGGFGPSDNVYGFFAAKHLVKPADMEDVRIFLTNDPPGRLFLPSSETDGVQHLARVRKAYDNLSKVYGIEPKHRQELFDLMKRWRLVFSKGNRGQRFINEFVVDLANARGESCMIEDLSGDDLAALVAKHLPKTLHGHLHDSSQKACDAYGRPIVGEYLGYQFHKNGGCVDRGEASIVDIEGGVAKQRNVKFDVKEGSPSVRDLKHHEELLDYARREVVPDRIAFLFGEENSEPDPLVDSLVDLKPAKKMDQLIEEATEEQLMELIATGRITSIQPKQGIKLSL